MPKLSFSVLGNREFRMLLISRICTVMALQAQAVIIGWQIYTLTGSPFMLGLTGLVEAVPAIFCAIFAGHVVDISHPQRVYLYCLGILMLNTIALTLIAGGFVGAQEPTIIFAIYAGAFISGLARSFAMPAAFSILPKIVQRKDMSAATAWQSSAFQVGVIAGPALAGIIYGGYGHSTAWMFPVFFMMLSFFSIAAMKLMSFERDTIKPKAFENIREGWVFIFKNPTLLWIMSIDMFAVLFGGAVAMLPAFADEILHVGPQGLGAMRAAPAIGAIITATLLAARPMQKITAVRLLWVVAGFGISMIGFGLSKYFWFSLFCLAASGAFDSVSMVIRSTMMQLLTPEKMRGRVAAVNSMFIISSNEIGAFRSGVTTAWLGLVPSALLGGFGTLLVVASATMSKNFRKASINADENA